MKKLIEYFSHQHLFANFLFILVLLGAYVFWQITQKEELPDIAMDFVQIKVVYPGASPQEVERLVTWPIEKELQNVDGIEDVLSKSTEGLSDITVELQQHAPNRDNIVTEIRNTVLSVQLPEEILDRPVISEFKSSKKAIIDLGIYFKDKKYLSITDRKKLQEIAHTLENRLINLPQINSISKQGYLKEELQILLDPNKLSLYRLPIRSIISAIQKNNVRQPAGSLENPLEERVTLDGELLNRKDLMNLPVQATFDSPLLRLGNIARIVDGFEKTSLVYKINGHEGIFFSVVKNSHRGILESVDMVRKSTTDFLRQVNQKEKIDIIFFDDESKDVRNRMDIIRGNGILGFLLIISSLFLFLNFRAGFWVAVGIPFTFGFTLIAANLLGYTINNMTLAAIIIVMGMVVDDAIVVSENIMRLESEGLERGRAVIEGTSYVLLPITASVLTTMAAFFPLWTFEGRLAMFIEPIPSIVSLMLIASLLESVFILPSHLNLDIPRPMRLIFSLGTLLLIERYDRRRAENRRAKGNAAVKNGNGQRAWFQHLEKFYIRTVSPFIKASPIVILFFALASALAFYIMLNSMKFTLFPREVTTELRINAEAPEGTRKYKTARLAERLEKVFLPYVGGDVKGMVSYIGMSHFRTLAQENAIWIRIELKDIDKLEIPYHELKNRWAEEMKKIEGLNNVRFSERRFGMSSGSPIEIIVQANDNKERRKIVDALVKKLEEHPELGNVHTGESYQSPEYSFRMRRELLQRLGIDASEVGTLLRSVLDGFVLYRFLVGDEEKDVRLSIENDYKRQLPQILNATVHNESGYLVPLRDLVTVTKTNTTQEIERLNRQRITRVYADFKNGSRSTPLEIAGYLERKTFPELGEISATANFAFDGEIKFSRESSGFFPVAIAMILFFIYVILTLQFQSMSRPLIILLTIPPAMASVIYTFLMHGMTIYGFFGIIGALGLAGVVVNDSIVLIKKLDDHRNNLLSQGIHKFPATELATVSASRLRAVMLTTITTVAGLFPTAYGVLGYDSMLAEMMLALAWGLVFGTGIILVLVPSLYKMLIYLENMFKS